MVEVRPCLILVPKVGLHEAQPRLRSRRRFADGGYGAYVAPRQVVLQTDAAATDEGVAIKGGERSRALMRRWNGIYINQKL